MHYLRHAVSDIKHLGALDSLSTETMETLHQFVKAAYPLTNRRQFKSQIIRILKHVESVQLFSQYIQYTIPLNPSGIQDQHASDGDRDGNADDSSGEHNSAVASGRDGDIDIGTNGRDNTLTTDSLGGVIYRYSTYRYLDDIHSIGEIIHLMPGVDVISPFVWFFVHRKHGTSHRTQRQVHQQHEVPEYLEWLYTWFSFKLGAPAPNKHYEQEIQTLHCNPGFKGKPVIFDPVVVEIEPQQSGLKRYRVAQICFLFSPFSKYLEQYETFHPSTISLPNKGNKCAIDDIYAFVLWFEPISSPLPHSKLRTVQKMWVVSKPQGLFILWTLSSLVN
ncbi:uncharacterized protein EI90DRAFT_3126859 [Cantharellus anzutake]|uniref:uncharacterized protein n=1 Tax=Cantharellus anzutake TaxID=1750568 RepID=UPI0019031F68|nr:uncharacterized protein EI90DRAFT_3126859 [Cantharellus anzutake]KAF8327556.1 hypothetical protein EI90DRAFT_3126859 [Cantharellus anzutake]